MNASQSSLATGSHEQERGWRAAWHTEDWWAVWLGLALVLSAYGLFAGGSSLRWIAVTPGKWSHWAQLAQDYQAKWPRYVAQFVLWLALLSLALTALGQRVRNFTAAFALVYALSLLIFTLGQWSEASRFNLEPPLVALAVGLAISNLVPLPAWADTGFRVEFYIKIGIVLLGATLPFTLLVWAGPVAILQASIVSLTTFFTIYWVGRGLGLEQRLSAVLGVGGSVCGVSAAIAVSGAVGARKQDTPVAITIVILWAIAMIFLLPFASRLLHLPAGVGGAWIGTSEFADAAGLAAAEAYGRMAGTDTGISGTVDQATTAFTLMKVVGRDVWIGIWAFVLALVATTYWGQDQGALRPRAAQIWSRFPKFVLGFLLASLIVTALTRGYGLAGYNKEVVPALVGPLKDLRTWAFIFCFLSIGLTTRFRELARVGLRPFLAFSAGVAVNVPLGYWLSAHVFADHWRNITP